MQDVALQGSTQRNCGLTGFDPDGEISTGGCGTTTQTKPDQYTKGCGPTQTSCTPEPSLVRYLDVLVASYGENAVRMAARVIAREAELPQGDDVDSYQARMIVKYLGVGNLDVHDAVDIWLSRRDGLERAPENVCLSPQDQASLTKYVREKLVPAYGQAAVERAANAYLDGTKVTGADVDSRQAAMLVKYFEYLNNPPVVSEALRAFLQGA